MSATTAVESTEGHDHDEDHDHPTDGRYIQIAVVLAVLTALEVATAFQAVEDLLGAALVPVLFGLMLLKFWLVAMFFMHLKFDQKVLGRTFLRG